MSPRVSAALTVWKELNDRQQGTLRAIYSIDQQVEESRRRAAAGGDWDSTPASVWRRIDFAHEPSARELFGVTHLQSQLAAWGWDNQGNGSTMVALAGRGLITRDRRPTTFGFMHTVALTREGRAAARAGISPDAGPVPKAALSSRAWEVLAKLWVAGIAGKPLLWGYSSTIEHVLIGKHVPPLARSIGGCYEITDRGRQFYREHYPAHTAAHPDVHAPHPDGADAEPWPTQADEILTRHRQFYRALCAAWQEAHDLHQAADREANADAPTVAPALPAAVADQITARHQLWQDTARQRAQTAAALTDDLHRRGVRAARGYAAAALAAFHAAVTGTDPLAGLREPDHDADDAWDEPSLILSAETGIHAIDAAVKKLHAAAVGVPLRRRGPAPRYRHRRRQSGTDRPSQPGAELVALAGYLHDHTSDGALLRRVHRVRR